MFPIEELRQFLDELPQEQLDEVESKGVARFQELLLGKYLH